MAVEENPYAGPAAKTDGWRAARSQPGLSIRGVLVGLPIAVLCMLGAGLVFGIIASATMSFDFDEAARQGGGPVALASQVPYARFFSLLVWSVGVLCGAYVAAGYSKDRQVAQGFLVGAMICTFLLSIRLVGGGASFATEDVLVLSFVAVGALGGALRGLRKATASARAHDGR